MPRLRESNSGIREEKSEYWQFSSSEDVQKIEDGRELKKREDEKEKIADEEQRVLRLMEGESLKMAGEEDEMDEKGPNKDSKRRM